MSASSPALNTSPVPMRTWKIEGPPEIVEGMVMKVMTSCSLRPASRARKPPIAWIPSCELPAIRITASEILEIFGEPPEVADKVASLMSKLIQKYVAQKVCKERRLMNPAPLTFAVTQ